jgi:hypothetical protein
MSWPAAPAEAQDGAGRTVGYLEELHVFPDKGAEFEKLMKKMVGVFEAHGFPYRLDCYRMDDLRYLAMWFVDGTAGIDNLNAAWEVLAPKWGEEKSAQWIKELYATMSHWETSVWIPRPDLSYTPENQTDEYRYIVWGLLPIKLGHKEEVDELMKRYIQAVAEHDIPHAWSAADGYVGVENPIIGFVEWSASAGSYWMRKDEEGENEELANTTNAVWEEILPHIRGFDWVAGQYLPQLSFRPKKEETTEEE